MGYLRLAFAVAALGLAGVAACVADEPTSGGGDDTTTGDAATDGTSGDGTTGSDGSTGGDSGPGVDSGPGRYCSTIAAPDGAADFFCADFDGTQFDEGFPDGSANLTDGSTLGASTDFAVSNPNSLHARVTSNAGDTAYLQWQKSGADSLLAVGATVMINPPSIGMVHQGIVSLLSIQEHNPFKLQSVSFVYVGSDAFNVKDADSNYVGYAVFEQNGSAELPHNAYVPVPTLATGKWTEVSFAFTNDGTWTLNYNGVPQAHDTPTFDLQDTTARVTIGNVDESDCTSFDWYFDNFRVATVRGDAGN